MRFTTVLILLTTSVGYAQAPATQRDYDSPDFKVQVWGDSGTEFSTLVSSYFELRTELEKGLPPLGVSEEPATILRAERALARRIRAARANAKRGDIFTPSISRVFKTALSLEMDAGTWEAIMDDNPGTVSAGINGTYPDHKPLSTVPANILAVLPRLPDAVQYRFVGRDLVLFDTKARVILDGIPHAIECADGDKSACHP